MVLFDVLPADCDRGLVEDLVRRMNLDHVDMPVHAREASVGIAVAIAVTEHPADVGMIDLDEFFTAAVPQRQPFDLHRGVVVKGRAASVLAIGPHDQRKRILVVERQRTAG